MGKITKECNDQNIKIRNLNAQIRHQEEETSNLKAAVITCKLDLGHAKCRLHSTNDQYVAMQKYDLIKNENPNQEFKLELTRNKFQQYKGMIKEEKNAFISSERSENEYKLFILYNNVEMNKMVRSFKLLTVKTLSYFELIQQRFEV
ncbi:hypothetical protein X798_00897 [Onchocerca flexuosa]|uniref:Uncharacterized protein n=1 Tax=Onchocerca flexuosa TaxID=387005 RepID=A0A238C2N0_9BILA|nr:hypothetical protein X798_00897 [Onchocerca flexuosa]